MMSRRRWFLVGALLSLGSGGLGGCGPSMGQLFQEAQQRQRADLERQAAYELRCDARQLQFTLLSKQKNLLVEGGADIVRSYGVDGCNKRAVYTVNPNSGAWILTSVSEETASPTLPNPGAATAGAAGALAPPPPPPPLPR